MLAPAPTSHAASNHLKKTNTEASSLRCVWFILIETLDIKILGTVCFKLHESYVE